MGNWGIGGSRTRGFENWGHPTRKEGMATRRYCTKLTNEPDKRPADEFRCPHPPEKPPEKPENPLDFGQFPWPGAGVD